MTPLFVLWLALAGADEPVSLETVPQRYKALSDEAPRLADGDHGQVPVWVRHAFDHEASKDEASFVLTAQAALVVRGGVLYAVLPRHLVVPDGMTRSIGDVSLGQVRSVRAEVRVSALGLVPEAVRFLPEQDLAALRIAPGDRQALIDLPHDAVATPPDPVLVDAVFGVEAQEIRIPGAGSWHDTPVVMGPPVESKAPRTGR